MDLNFEGLANAHIITDDVLIVGSGLDWGSMDDHDHDRCLLQVLNWYREVLVQTFGTYQWFEFRP